MIKIVSAKEGKSSKVKIKSCKEIRKGEQYGDQTAGIFS